MSALAEALVAAQRRAISAMEKWYVAGALDRAEATAIMSALTGEGGSWEVREVEAADVRL